MRKLKTPSVILLFILCITAALLTSCNYGNVQYTCIHPISVNMKPSMKGETIWIVLAKEGEYRISDDWKVGNFKSSKLANQVSQAIGGSCKIKTYGRRQHLMSWYPQIKSVSLKSCD